MYVTALEPQFCDLLDFTILYNDFTTIITSCLYLSSIYLETWKCRDKQ